MKKNRLVALALALTLVVGAGIGGTVAWLVSTPEKVVNTFTVGKLEITLDEAKVDEWGVPVEGAARVPANDYTLIPGHVYQKDPVVHVQPHSEKAYVFVKLEGMPVFNGFDSTNVMTPTVNNNIQEDGVYGDRVRGLNLWSQFQSNGWQPVKGADNVFFRVQEATGDQTVDLPVFQQFGISDKASAEDLAKLSTKGITITAYACQFDGFKNEVAAWNANFAAK